MTTRTLWVRADGSHEIGLGHVMRTLALAERATEYGLHARYVLGGDRSVVDIVSRRGIDADFLRSSEDDWLGGVQTGDVVVFDGYDFTSDLMEAAAHRGATVGAIDDWAIGRFPVAVLLNQNPVQEHDYDLLPDTRLLVGPTYALIRKEFVEQRRPRDMSSANTLLITLGGSDVAGLTNRVATVATEHGAFQQVLVLVGPATTVEIDRSLPIDIVHGPDNVAAVLASADVAVSAAGSTTWELLCLGMPTALVQVADNQQYIGPGVDRVGAGIFVGTTEQVLDRLPSALDALAKQHTREALHSKALDLVPGNGAHRFLDALSNASQAS